MRKWSKAEIESLISHAKKGLTNEEIALKLNRTKDSVEWKLYKNLRIRKNDLRLPKFSEEELYDLYYNKKLTLEQIAQNFKCSVAFILNKMKKLKIPRDRKRCVKKSKRIPKKDYKKLTPAKAFIMGVLCGDGSIHKQLVKWKGYEYFSYGVWLNSIDKDFVHEFKKAVKEVYGIIIKTHRIPGGIRKLPSGYSECKDQFIAKVSWKKVYEDLIRYGDFGTYSWRVPIEIIRGHKELIAHFLRGFFDSEGNIDIKNRSIEVTSCNKRGLEDVQELLKKFKILATLGMSKKSLFRLRFSSSAHLKIFKEKINFSIKRKRNALGKAINNLKKEYKYSAEDYWNVLRLRIKRYSSNKISMITGIPRSTVKSWFKKPAYIAKRELKLGILPDDWDLLVDEFPLLVKWGDRIKD
jgi:intein-encoded DNA endonuclease-like protein